MLSVRVPLATIVDPQQPQQQLQLSPLKGLSLADKENTVRTRGPGRGGGGLLGRGQAPSPRVSPQPPALSGSRVLASKTARRIFQEPAEPVSGGLAAGWEGAWGGGAQPAGDASRRLAPKPHCFLCRFKP